MATLLRYIKSKDPDLLTMAVGALPFKVEIKGSPVKDKGKWILFFTLDEEDPKALRFENTELD